MNLTIPKYLLFFIATIFFACDLFAQEDALLQSKKQKEKINYTLFFNYGWNFHFTNFTGLPNYPNCCDSFKSGMGNGFEFGAGIQQWLGIEDFYIGTKFSFGNLNGLIKKTETLPVTVSGNLVNASIENGIDVSLNSINILPFVTYRISRVSDYLFVSLGGKFGFPISANFAQSEQLISPNVGTFENGYRVRNIRSGDLPNVSPVLYGGALGAFYELPLNKDKYLKLVPEINLNYWFNSPVKSLSWNAMQLTFGLGIRYNTPPPPPPPPPPPILPKLLPLNYPDKSTSFTVDINHKVLNLKDDTQTDYDGIIIEDFTYTNLKPLLNYIFFEENSAVIPPRYHLLTADEAKNFNYRDLQGLDALETYYHYLNIVGYRMREYSAPTLELVGTNANVGAEQNNLALSQARAESVKRYLCNVWQIDPSRITINKRNLPKDPTRASEGISIGEAENRRVEIYSSDNRITESILSFDTVSVLKNDKIHFTPDIQSSFGIENWKLTVGKENTEVQSWSDIGILPDVIIWNPESKINLFSKLKDLDFDLVVSDKMGQSAKSQVKSLPIKKITIASKRAENIIDDKDLEYYSLILFDFGSRSLEAKHNKVVDFVRTRIKPNSKVVISGYTDIIGQAEVNKKIAADRARAVAARLNFRNVEIRGIGKDELLYDNSYPEGRFYCRTVTISIETPITENFD